ncbi:acyl-CoA synthetase [Polaromonas hydrogenivorans]|uniref:Acyl-CoA synthetase n=1 Tax=Polaromonas hydrogenivorans TaxID=335476 RepID=A0AAU7LPK1_9BURK
MKPARPTTASASAQWQQNPERSSLFMLRVMTWLSLRLGRRASRVVLYGIAAYFLAFAPAARRMSGLYLRRVLKLPSNAAVGWLHLFRHFFSFAAAVHDRIYLLNDRFDLFDIRVHNQSLVDDILADGQGIFLIGAHLGSFEVLRALGRKQPGLRVAMMMYEENARKINATLSAINPNAQQDIIALGHIGSMIQAHELLAQGSIVGMLGDRSLGNDDTRPIHFLGDPAELPLGPFRMAAIMKRPVLFMTGLYRGGNRYDIHFEALADFSALPPRGRTLAVEDAMTRYAALMEQYCYSAPYNWFNFFDFWQVGAPRLPRTLTPSAETPET